MGRRKKGKPLEGVGRYVIESQPMLRPPQPNGQECTEPVHWYYASPGWARSKKDATVFCSSSAAVTEISALRRLVVGVEFTLMPVDEHDRTFYRPMR